MTRSKKFIVFTLILTLVLSLSSLGLTYGAGINDKIKDKQAELEEGKEKEKELGDQVKNLEASIAQTEKELKEINAEISSTEEKIAKVTAELEKIEKEMAQQNEDLDSRLRTMYKNGDGGLLQVLLGSTSITDFMANLEMVKTIHTTDVDILEEMEEQHLLIAEQQEELKNLQASMKAQKEEQASKQATLESDKAKVAAEKNEVAADNAEIVEQIQALEADAARMTNVIQGSTDPNKVYQGGSMQWPVPGRYSISSPYGSRTHPVTGQASFHTGIDIPAPRGTPVVAANGGKVISAGSQGSYGTTVVIDHGSGISTLYAHNSSLAVSYGQEVQRGQTIAYVGSTGRSTGNHCHFEVRINGKHTNPRNGWV